MAKGTCAPGGSTTLDRFWDKVRRSGEDDCWEWTAYTTPRGYGHFAIRHGLKMLAHRFAYELLVGPIPEGLELDHTCHTKDPACVAGDLCSHRRCVNPAHLEPVTKRENGKRSRAGVFYSAKTQCPSGHAYDEENTRWYGGRRYCRACHRDRGRAARRAAKGL